MPLLQNEDARLAGLEIRSGQGGRARWYAVYTRSNFEKKVAAELAGKAVEHFLPLTNEFHRWSDRKKQVELPVFPNYVFARFIDGPAGRLPVLRTNGVVRILGPGDSISEAIPDQEIEAVRRLLAAKGPYLRQPFLKQGAKVRVTRGPLKDLEGFLLRLRSQTRLVVSVGLLSQSVATEIDIRDIEPVATAPLALN